MATPLSTYDSQTEIQNRHDFNLSFTNEYDTNNTNTTILTPSSGKSLKISGYMINTEGTSGIVKLHFLASANTVGKMFAVNGNSGYVPIVVQGQRNETLRLTSDLGADQNFYILVNYKEV